MHLDSEFKSRNTKQTKIKLNPVESQLEIAEIVKHVKTQSTQIEALKVELFMLKRKDTSSLTMPTLVLPSPQILKKPQILRPQRSSTAPTNSNSNSSTNIILPPIHSSSASHLMNSTIN